MKLKFAFDDGGRAAAGYKGTTGDCVTRSIAIASGKPYREVYDAINSLAQRERRKRGRSSARAGVHKATYHKYLLGLGFTWTPTMKIGSGCKVHLCADEMPQRGRYIVVVSKHLTALIDGVLRDLSDPQREYWSIEPDRGQDLKPNQHRNENGVCTLMRRCVYGYYTAPEAV